MMEIRQQARQRRAELGLEPDIPTPAEGVLGACLSAAGLERHFVSPDDPMLAGAMAVLDLPLGVIIQDETRPLPEQRFDAAHELAHAWLHRDAVRAEPPRCVPPDLNPNETEETPGSAQSKVDGYSPRQRRENEANIFAAELLLPGPLARTLFLDENMSSQAIAEALGLPSGVVQKQLADSVLLPPPPEQDEKAEETPASAAVSLDSWQQDAAQTPCGPLLVGAGPGTGKTKTLVGRCQFLTQARGVPAKNILALTFSRKAAAEMKERLLAAGVGTQHAGPWVGTFHAFGLEVLYRFGERLGLAGEIKLLDPLDAVTLLELHLPELGLDALDNLYNPAMHLGGILGQISRAKDERCGPARYAKLCEAMAAAAQADAEALAARPGKVLKREQEAVEKALENATKAREVARCYAVYERLMAEQGFLDFGDLIRRTTELLEAHPDVLAILQSEYPQVLADEYQDVNRACAYLVRLLAGAEARGLWAVGDHRQSIYQFQGASPANVAAFERDYPAGKRLELGVNYRSRRPIVSLFGGAASEPGSGFSGWQAHRGDAEEALAYPAVTLARAPDAAGQARGIAEAVQALRNQGWDHRQQAILCRTHSQASELAGLLTDLGVPVLYLGALLERPEVKDLLCLLSLLTGEGSSALVRVASWPEYGVPLDKSLALLAEVRQGETQLIESLQDASLHPGLLRLGRHLAELDTMDDDPAALLRHYLFGLSEYGRGLISGEKPFVRMGRCLAVHQLLGLANGFDRRLVPPSTQNGVPSKVREFLAHLRRLSSAGISLRGVLPPEAEALDAVRLLTAHAAKGLEFPVVFVPNLGAGQFPARGRHDGIPEPPGLCEGLDTELDTPLDEERCLFFVALSRARDHLVLSRAETSGSERAVKPSPLLAHLEDALAALGVTETPWASGGNTPAEADALTLSPPEPLPEHSQSALETYGRCPRQYYYAQVLKLPGAFVGGGYPQFLSCVRQTLSWQEDREARGETVTDAAMEEKLQVLWAEHGPVGHLHEEKYRAAARLMLANAARLRTSTERRADTRTLKATLSNCRVSVRPDVLRLDAADGSVVVARRMTGRPGHDDHTDKKLALYRRAAQETHPDRPVRVALHYLAGGVSVSVDAPETKQQRGWEAGRIAKYENAARGIQLDLFPAETGDECARCAYHLLCPL